MSDFGLQDRKFFERCRQRLPASVGEGDRLKLISDGEPWPFESVVVVVSNQVLEHVGDHDHFFAEHKRVLRPRGIGLHVFPAKEVIWELHVNLPLAHRIRRREYLERYIRLASYIRLGKGHTGDSRPERSRQLADFVLDLTNYQTTSQLADCASAHGLRASYTYTPAYYAERLGLNNPPRKGGLWPWKYIANVTMLVEHFK